MIAFRKSLSQICAENNMPHEAVPYGVPVGYSWREKPVRDQWNNQPVGYTHWLGWGQFFFASDAQVIDATVQFRNMRTYALTPGGWTLLSAEDCDGAQFNPDFSGNAATPAIASTLDAGLATVRFQGGKAYHFWPKHRATIPVETLAYLVLIEARAIDSAGIMLGLGADYWLSASAPYPNNKGVAVGRFSRLTTTWDTYGFTTATETQLSTFRQ